MLEDNKKIEIFDISLIENKKVNLYNDNKQQVNYSVFTDGIVSHYDTRIVKKPYSEEEFLEGTSTLKKYGLEIKNATIVLVIKKYREKEIRNLYINQDLLINMISDRMYQVLINERENIMVKKMEKKI